MSGRLGGEALEYHLDMAVRFGLYRSTVTGRLGGGEALDNHLDMAVGLGLSCPSILW